MLPFYPFLHLVNPPRVCSFGFFFPFDTTKNARWFIDALWCAIWWHLVLREHVTFKHATAAWASNAVLFTHMANTHDCGTCKSSNCCFAARNIFQQTQVGPKCLMVGGTRSPWIKLCTYKSYRSKYDKIMMIHYIFMICKAPTIKPAFNRNMDCRTQHAFWNSAVWLHSSRPQGR